MREQVLAGFDGDVTFEPSDEGPWQTRLEAEMQAGSGRIGVLGALHGNFSPPVDGLADLSEIDVSAVAPGFVELGRLETDEQKYIPWMQASFVMAAHRDALEYLPEGADLMALNYDEQIAWGANIHEATGGWITCPRASAGLPWCSRITLCSRISRSSRISPLACAWRSRRRPRSRGGSRALPS